MLQLGPKLLKSAKRRILNSICQHWSLQPLPVEDTQHEGHRPDTNDGAGMKLHAEDAIQDFVLPLSCHGDDLRNEGYSKFELNNPAVSNLLINQATLETAVHPMTLRRAIDSIEEPLQAGWNPKYKTRTPVK